MPDLQNGPSEFGPTHFSDVESLQVAVEGLLGHGFGNRSLLLRSLTHSSYSNERSSPSEVIEDNERLEFLGDAVIGLIVAELLMERYPQASEGKLSRWRSNLVSRKTLAEIALHWGLGNYLRLGRGEKQTGGADKTSILAGVFEAVVGALYLDGGLEVARTFLIKIFAPYVEAFTDETKAISRFLDRKTALQEKTQSLYRQTPTYRLVDTWGLEHEKSFRVEILLGESIVADGEGRSKKDAEQEAAKNALGRLGLGDGI